MPVAAPEGAEDGTRRSSGPKAAAGVVALALAAAFGVAAVAQNSGTAPEVVVRRVPDVDQPPAALPVEVPTRTVPSAPPTRAARPVAIGIPALGVDSQVVPIGVDLSGTLTPPDDPQLIGWWRDGVRPGEGRGRALFAGHKSALDGAFDHLAALEPGALVVIATADGELRYVVESVETLDKDALAGRAADLFRATGPERLVLVTCADWDGSHHLSNTVVMARPA